MEDLTPEEQKELNSIKVPKRFVPVRTRNEVSADEYHRRLVESLGQDSYLVSQEKEHRIDKALVEWKKRVGPRFADATTENPVITDRVNRLAEGNGIKTSLVMSGDLGVGKAQPVSEPILTPDGWISMGDIKTGDNVIGSDGKPTRVIGVYPQGLREIFKITFNDGSYTFADGDHLWQVATPYDTKKQKNRVMTTKEIMDSGVTNNSGQTIYSIPMVKPVEFEEKDFTVKPYLLGALLGDGNIRSKGVVFTSADEEILEKINSELFDGLQLVKLKNNPYDYGITRGKLDSSTRNPLIVELEKMNLVGSKSHDKFIPKSYMFASVEQRVELLRGLMDTHGFYNSEHCIQFSSASKQLADDLSELVQSLGGTVRRSVKNNIKGANHPAYIVTLNTGDINPFMVSRKADMFKGRVKYKPARRIKEIIYTRLEAAQCIKVEAEDSLYVTRGYIVTHNTWMGYAFINLAIAAGAVTPGQIIADTETAILGKISSSGFKRAELLEELFNPRYKIYFIDDVGQGYFSTEQGRREVWYELIDHVYSHDLTLIMTTNKEFKIVGGKISGSPALEQWIGGAAYDRLKHIVGHDGLIIPGNVNRRPGVAEKR